ncbi:esterase-like activity of phytase family protein [Novosphingobium sp.]|uniref:esterase-like activity of phytase family protein n=1 Tax=Novosphingobium sp. TaxID=1874826 RepID=UPI0026249848|nr:esterase-like activity of phytase family protein [Novosphingobium sp.]
MMRALKLALLILALMPAVWLHGDRPPEPSDTDIGLVDLMPALRSDLPDTGALRLEGAWRITGRARVLGTLSGLAQTPRGLLAVGDRGGILRFAWPDRPGPWHAVAGRLINLDWRKYRYPTDPEAVFIDPGSGDLIVAFEDAPMLERFSADLARRSSIPLPVLAEWPDNKGAEGMARLADGRTVVIGETYGHWFDRTRHPGLIWSGLPRPFEAPLRFELVLPAGYRPSELAQMPDGRLLVLGRHFSLAGFRSVLAVFAPQDIRPGAVVTPQVVARIDDPRIRDNYEGMTVTREGDGSQMVWLISDSNEMVQMQRTLVLKLRIGPEVR